MVFSSKVFLFVFFPLTVLLYLLTPKKLKNYTLLLMSLLFYAFGEPVFVFVMAGSILVNYLLALLIGRSSSPLARKWLLALCVALNIGALVAFKYLAFLTGILNALLGTQLQVGRITLPIGISFYTFQTLSYVIDVYRRSVAVQRNPMKLGMYVSFFPQLIAGPIVRYADIAKEIDSRSVSLDDLVDGVRRFIVGLSKKVLLADTFARCADKVFALKAEELTTPIAWAGILAYTLQIYFDFSGYSDMAIGMGRMFGFHFLENFNYPYVSASLTEFWRRWHISLSTWFRDYLYIPLGGNRRGNVYLNLSLVFLLTGLWHGASMTFVLWGLWHGAFLIAERLIKRRGGLPGRVPKPLKHGYTLLAVILGWVLFRSDTLAGALHFAGVMFGRESPGFKPFNLAYVVDARLVTMGLVGLAASLNPLGAVRRLAAARPAWRGALHYASLALAFLLFAASLLFVMNQGYSPFIYFRF